MLLLWRASLFLCSVHSPDAFSEGLLIRDDLFRLWSIEICSFLKEAGEFYLEESGFYAMPTQEEMQKLARMGAILLLIENHIPIN